MFLTLSSRQVNPVAVLSEFIKKLKIPVSSTTIKTALLEHPDYPSLLAVSDCLTTWKVPHQTFKIDKSEYSAEVLSFPFITYLKLNGGQFIVVDEIANGSVRYTDEYENNAQLSELEFLKRWEGIILYAEKSETSGEPNYRNVLLKGWLNHARLPFLIFVFLLAILSFVDFSYATWAYIVFFCIKLLGTGVSVLLLMQSIDINNPFLQNLCSLGRKNNCNTILSSDAAKVFSWLNWSEVGLFYFAGSLICLLLNPGAVSLLAWLSLACLPYTFYSIAYQIKIKNWCILCCTIQVLLWCEALLFTLNHSFLSIDFSSIPMLSSMICFLVPVAIWIFLKPLLIKSAQINPLNQQLRKFKYNGDLFKQLLTSQQRYSISEDLKPVAFGNPEAENVITIVSNPYCGPCSAAHKVLDEWLDSRNDIQVKIVFATANQEGESRTKVARHITALSLFMNEIEVRKALNDWFSQSSKKYETWAEQYPVSFNGQMSEVTEKQKAWCDMAEIQFTPTILINGYKLNDPYRLEDIRYLLV